MLNIGKLVASSWGYYLDKVARSQEEYYTGAGEAAGYWAGSGAGLLGLGGTVSDDGLHRLLTGAHPDTGAPLPTSRTSQRRVAGFDLTFRAPKSVSLLSGLGDALTAATVRGAHEQAIDQALGYLEREATVVRRGASGRTHVAGAGLLGACYQHRTSRAGDPLLHTHVLVANAAQGPDGRWSALDGRALYAHAKTAGFLYEAVLRHELSARLGVGWGPVRNGIADVDGIPRGLIEAFSTRRHQILTMMRQRNTHTARAAQIATLATRPAKPAGITAGSLRAQWRRRAATLGFDQAALQATFRASSALPTH